MSSATKDGVTLNPPGLFLTTDMNETDEEVVLKVDPLDVGLYLTIGTVGILGNGFTLIVLCSSRAIRNKTVNMFLISQSILDFLCAVILIATAWQVVWENKGGHFGISGILRCYLWDSKHQLWMILLCSTCNLVGLNIERWLSIIYPVWHKTSFTRKHALLMILSAWLFGPAFTLARQIPTTRVTKDGICFQNQIWPNQFWFSFTTILVCLLYLILPLFFILSMYLSIYIFLRKRAYVESNQASKLTAAKWNVLKTLVFLTVLFFLCWVWNVSFFLLATIGVPLSFNSPFYNFTVFMTNVNCCVNPFCYALQYREFQAQTKRLYCKLRSRRDENITTAESESGNSNSTHI